MDPKSLLDYVLFQLTPTRTRCDLVVCSAGHKEKLASGLVEPFISHLKFAKEQIPKGGYSITLRPPSSEASWFTKATFQRFVRFVSTPEVLERFVRVEREIQQIESSIESNELSNTHIATQGADGSLSAADANIRKSTDSTKSKGESERIDDVSQEENSKIRLQRLLGTRKVLLRKEQAMAYARALAAGFEMDNIDDLISFADAFGASRLREACIDFKDLCKKKNTDRLWMDELAAVEACVPSELSYLGTSGIILACESGSEGLSTGKLVPNGSLDASSDSTASQANSDSNKDNNVPASDQMSSTSTKVPVQMPWTNQIPPFMYNNQGSVQQMPPFQGYPFPGMIPVPPYYQGNMVWPPNVDESSHGRHSAADYPRNQKPNSRKKEKSHSVKSLDTTEDDEQTESSDSDTHTQKKSNRKKHGKSSKTVVIRNINYITSKKKNDDKDGVSDDSSSMEDEDFLKQKVDDAVATFEKHRKSSLHNDKKRNEHKSSSSLNGSDESSDPLTNKSVEGKRNEHWDAFQDILMKNDSSINGVENENTVVLDEHFVMKNSIDLESEKVTKQRTMAIDSFVVNGEREYESRVDLEDFSNGENFRANLKSRDCGDEKLLFSQRLEEPVSFQQKQMFDSVKDSSIIKNGKGEDWFTVENSQKSVDQTVFGGDYSLSLDHERSQTEKSKTIVPIDDSFMIQDRSAVDDQYDSQWKTDISMVSDLRLSSEPNNGSADLSQDKVGQSGTHEPDDLCVVLERDAGLDSVVASWTPEMDYGTEISFKEMNKKLSAVETKDQVEEKLPVKSKATNGKNTAGPGKDLRSKTLRGSLAKSNSDILTKSKKPSPARGPMIQKTKLEKEEEIRKKMEELVIQRQKRIAERSAGSGFSPASPKKVPVGSKTASLNKHRPQSTTKV